MKNYYYVVSFNLTNPRVKSMLDRQKITAMTGFMIDFKLRSKLFISFSETTLAAYDDFQKKLALIYPDKQEHHVSQFSIANPAVFSTDGDLIQSLAEKFGGKYLNNWDENCSSVIFFADNPDAVDDVSLNPNSWMFKYEIFFSEDAIELSGNGDFVFSQMNVPYTQFNSTYH